MSEPPHVEPDPPGAGFGTDDVDGLRGEHGGHGGPRGDLGSADVPSVSHDESASLLLDSDPVDP